MGRYGVILHYDGSSWSQMSSITYNSLTLNTLMGVWGSSSSDVFAVGDGGTILHYDGNSWSEYGAAAPPIMALRESGVALHRMSLPWSPGALSCTITAADRSPMSLGVSNSLYGVWGSSSSDVFAVGNFGIILHYDGSSWSGMADGISNSLHGVWGEFSSDVFAVGDGDVSCTMTAIAGAR